jgi:hypothetical protein
VQEAMLVQVLALPSVLETMAESLLRQVQAWGR